METVNPANVINSLAISIISGAYLLIFSLLLILWNRIEKRSKELSNKIEKVGSDINKLSVKIRENLEMNDERMDVIDRVASASTDHQFSSRLVAEGKQPFPSTETITRIVKGAD